MLDRIDFGSFLSVTDLPRNDVGISEDSSENVTEVILGDRRELFNTLWGGMTSGVDEFLARINFPNMSIYTQVASDRKKLFFSEKSYDSSELDDCLKKNDYKKIIKDSDLFWLAFCKSMHPYQHDEISSFLVKIDGSNITCIGTEREIERVKGFVEEIRTFFLEALEAKGRAEFLVMKFGDHLYLSKPSGFAINIGSSQAHIGAMYNEYFKKGISDLAGFCGAYCAFNKNLQSINPYPPLISKEMQLFDSIQISLKREFHIAYLVKPKPISENNSLATDMYFLYKQNLLCDFSLKINDKNYGVHSTVLYLHGGDTFKTMLTSAMKESVDKTIVFSGYSEGTIKAFIEFIYLGPKGFLNKMTSKKQIEIDLIELFKFANVYQISTLIDCCTNLMSLFATSDDLVAMEELLDKAVFPHNKHLNKICDCLREDKVKLPANPFSDYIDSIWGLSFDVQF